MPITKSLKFQPITGHGFKEFWINLQISGILMAVGTWQQPDGTFQNRGIFATPTAVFAKYPPLSILLHGFTAKYWSQVHGKCDRMFVRPLAVMRNILLDAFQHE